MKNFLKDYGAAVGPALAFLFGLIALFGKYEVDQLTASWTIERRFNNLKALVAQSAPASTFFPSRSTGGMLHADEARNLTNLARFYARLLALKPQFESMQNSLADARSTDTITQFHNMKWWFEILLKTTEEWRSTKGFRMSEADFDNIQRDWKNLLDATSSKDPLQYLGHGAARP